MITIHKYPVIPADKFDTAMPQGARVLSVQVQGDEAFMWALVESTALPVERRFAVRGTGHDCAGLSLATFVGTFQLHDGALVFHLFDLGEP